jgi:DNA-binding transcriptional MerR regulator
MAPGDGSGAGQKNSQGVGQPSRSQLGLGIAEVSAQLAVPAPTLRSWERRYSLPVGHRTAGGHRRYTPEDVLVLQRLRDEIALGRPPAAAAAFAVESVQAPATVLVEELIAGALELDSLRVIASLDRARMLLGLDSAVDEVLMPAMRELGQGWSEGRYDVAHEHLASGAVQQWLRQVGSSAPDATSSGAVLLACALRESHTLALDALTVLLGQRGVDCRSLGARTPIASLLLAVRETEAVAVVLVSHVAEARPAAVAALEVLAATPAAVFYAGGSFSSERARAGLPGTYLDTHLATAADQVAACV